MPVYLTPSEIELINKQHHDELSKLLTSGRNSATELPLPLQLPNAGDDPYEGLNTQQHRRGHRERDRIGDVLQLPDGVDRKEVGMEEIMQLMNQQHEAVLKTPWFVQMTSNRQKTLCSRLLKDLDQLLRQVPVRCKDFQLLAVQRLAIMSMVNAVSVETYTSCEIPRDAMEILTCSGRRKEGFDVKYCLEADCLPTFTVAPFCTGSGKTVMAVMAALVFLCCRERWEGLKASFRDVISSRVRESHSGLCKTNRVDCMQLARVCIMFVPSNLVSHWKKTVNSAVFGATELYGQQLDVVVWVGLGRDQTMKSAYSLAKPVLWILPLESDSMKAVRTNPELAYAICIMDELNAKMIPRCVQRESTPCFTYVVSAHAHACARCTLTHLTFAPVSQTQATIEALESCCVGAPRHPLRVAFGDNFMSMRNIACDMHHSNYKGVQRALEHFCKMSQFAVAEFVRRAVAEGVVHHLPRGIVVHRVPLRAGTLAALARGADLVRLSLPELAVQMLEGAHLSTEMRDRIRAVFTKADVVQSEVVLDDLKQTINRLPVPASFAEHAARKAVERLLERLEELFRGDMPCCPVSLHPIPRERVRILKCCTAIMDADSIAGCRNVCPLCRGEIVTTELADQPDPTAGSGTKRAAGKEAGAKKQKKLAFAGLPTLQSDRVREKNQRLDSDGDSDLSADDEGPRNEDTAEALATSEQEFEARLAAIAAAQPHSVDGVLQILQAQVAFKPSSRVLLCFGFQPWQRDIVRQIISRIKAGVSSANVTDIEQLRKDYMRWDEAKARFDDRLRNPTPQICIINTTQTSSSVQGLDLVETDLTIIADQCTMQTQRQALGRGLRMRVRPPNMKPEERFPAKRVVVASISHVQS